MVLLLMGDQLLGVYGWARVSVGSSSSLGQAMTFLVVFLFPLSLSSEVKFSLIHPKENKKQGETISGTERIVLVERTLFSSTCTADASNDSCVCFYILNYT